jgi:hypothetical protein
MAMCGRSDRPIMGQKTPSYSQGGMTLVQEKWGNSWSQVRCHIRGGRGESRFESGMSPKSALMGSECAKGLFSSLVILGGGS